ncbi:hypothetical protein SISNIDRAFT_453793 [Sistotremastrum niveocremeum HHB9708]|uniref:Uncharacterized protein n=2 Tax=Sistotremastraceae TaxID=3402574 RepID=A0A164VE78_9AGAM|nr:hypothetical protein SISNIDRAFT_453793 [Sistotremastrum niveocremeum HHB9708]KZT32972.1 hypothetical protein SISSUDRAFT_1054781 [Sistotremastrum suecicum HHB10207 ss-3]
MGVMGECPLRRIFLSQNAESSHAGIDSPGAEITGRSSPHKQRGCLAVMSAHRALQSTLRKKEYYSVVSHRAFDASSSSHKAPTLYGLCLCRRRK